MDQTLNFTLHRVRPAGGRFEGYALLCFALILLAVLALYVRENGRKEESQQIYEWQVSTFNTLTGADQAIYNALYRRHPATKPG